jgi:hypothetical protein
MPLEWPVRPVARSVQLVELRRATVPNSWPSSRARFSYSSPQRRDDDDEAALVVADAGAGGAVAVAAEALERRIRLEHGVEMADQQDALAPPVAPVRRDDVACALRRRHVHPAHLPLEQRDRARLLLRDHLRHPPLRRARLGARDGGDGDQQAGEESKLVHGHAPLMRVLSPAGRGAVKRTDRAPARWCRERRVSMGSKQPRAGEQPADLPDDLDENPGIGQSKGIFARAGSKDSDLIAGENTVEGDVENAATLGEGADSDRTRMRGND